MNKLTDAELDEALTRILDEADAAAITVQQERTVKERPRTPLTIDLEQRLAARVGLPRQTPKGPVNLGDRPKSEDRADDAPLNIPSDVRTKMC